MEVGSVSGGFNTASLNAPRQEQESEQAPAARANAQAQEQYQAQVQADAEEDAASQVAPGGRPERDGVGGPPGPGTGPRGGTLDITA